MTDLPKLDKSLKRALAAAGVKRLEDLEGRAEEDIAKVEGMGPKAMKTLKKAMNAFGIYFID